MSVQFGHWNFEGEQVDETYLQRVRAAISPYTPDGWNAYLENGVSILFAAFHTTKESHQERQPCVLKSGAVLTWDGRLDNREDLRSQLTNQLESESPDLLLVAAAYEQWGTECFPRLIGDWAFAAWNSIDRSLVLATDFAGARHLYYCVEGHHAAWCTILDPLVLLAGHSFGLEEEYIAGWLSGFPSAHLTPYVGIHRVPPSHFLRVANGKIKITKYWDFDPTHRVRYRTDLEYEEHFRILFCEAVRRRLRSERPVLAELSGGMDSSSIVCMADTILKQGHAEAPRLDTISYYDDSEPNWDERRYFNVIEQRRGQTGCHIDVHPDIKTFFNYVSDHFAATPASHAKATAGSAKFAQFLSSEGYRVILSGIGGDEVLGGVPTPIPELADLLARFHLATFMLQMVAWAIATRKPLVKLLYTTACSFLPARFSAVERSRSPIPWIEPGFAKSQRRALRGYYKRLTVLGPLPSFQDDLATFDGLRSQLASSAVTPDCLYETSYPYTDRNLLEFLYAIPREQLVRPRQRRSLMRRALAGMVPTEILNRKGKAVVSRGPLSIISANWTSLVEAAPHMITGALGIIQPSSLVRAMDNARHGLPSNTVAIMRTVEIEHWLQNQWGRGGWDRELSRTFDTRRRIRVTPTEVNS